MLFGLTALHRTRNKRQRRSLASHRSTCNTFCVPFLLGWTPRPKVCSSKPIFPREQTRYRLLPDDAWIQRASKSITSKAVKTTHVHSVAATRPRSRGRSTALSPWPLPPSLSAKKSAQERESSLDQGPSMPRDRRCSYGSCSTSQRRVANPPRMSGRQPTGAPGTTTRFRRQSD